VQPVRHQSIRAAASKVIDNLQKIGKEQLTLADIPAADRELVARAVGNAATFSLLQATQAVDKAAAAIEQADSNWSIFRGGRNGMAEEFEVQRAARLAPAATPLALRLHSLRAASVSADQASLAATTRLMVAKELHTSEEVQTAVNAATQLALDLPVNTAWEYARDRFFQHGDEAAYKAVNKAKDTLDAAGVQLYSAGASLQAAQRLQPGAATPLLKELARELGQTKSHTQNDNARKTVDLLLNSPENSVAARDALVGALTTRVAEAQAAYDLAATGLKGVIVQHSRSLVNMQQAPDDGALIAERKAAQEAVLNATTASLAARFKG